MEGFDVQPNSSNNHPPYTKPPAEAWLGMDQEVEKTPGLKPEEVIGKLAETKEKYEEEIGKLEAGEEFGEVWLGTYHGALQDWKSDMSAGVRTVEKEEVLGEVNNRLARIYEGLVKHDERYREEDDENRILH